MTSWRDFKKQKTEKSSARELWRLTNEAFQVGFLSKKTHDDAKQAGVHVIYAVIKFDCLKRNLNLKLKLKRKTNYCAIKAVSTTR